MIGTVLVLAAGKSTRIASVSGGIPKPLVAVRGRPIIGWSLRWLANAGITNVWVNLHHRPELIRQALGDGTDYGVKIRYSSEDEIQGTAGALREIGPSVSGTTLVVYGDNLIRFDLAEFVKRHRALASRATIAVFDQGVHVNTRIAGGRVVIDAAGSVTAFVEGGEATTSPLVNAGAYLIEPSVIAQIGTGFQDFGKDVFPGLVERRELFAHVMEQEGYCLGLDTPESYAMAEQLIASDTVQLT